MPQHYVLYHLETGHVLDRMSYSGPDAGNIHTALIFRSRPTETRNLDTEILLQQLQQGGVETWLVIIGDHSDAAAHGFTLKRHRQKDQRCAIAPVVLILLLPEQEPHGQKQGVGTTFLQ